MNGQVYVIIAHDDGGVLQREIDKAYGPGRATVVAALTPVTP